MRIFMMLLCAALQLPLVTDCSTEPSETVSEPLTEGKEWEDLCASHQVKTWYMNALDNIDLLTTTEDTTNLPILDLFETRGEDVRFDRKASPVRKNIEKDILGDIEEVVKNEPVNSPVRLLSMGCTGQLQDWYIIGQLIRLGRKNIELTLVDPGFFGTAFDGLKKLRSALEAEGIKLTLSFFGSLENLVKAHPKPFHAAYAIEYHHLFSFEKNTWNSLSMARKLLVNDGHLFVSYKDEIFTIDSHGKIHVVETSLKNQLIREAIVSAQHSNPRPKDCSLRFQLISYDPFFTTGPFLYAISDLLQEGYQDIMIYTHSPRLTWFSETDLSELFADTSAGSNKARLFWKKTYYISQDIPDRRDMVIIDLGKLDLSEESPILNRSTVILGKLVSRQGHWIVWADQLGLWDVDGLGRHKSLLLPKGQAAKAKNIMEKIFAPGLHWNG